MNQAAATLIDSSGESPEAFVRRFLTAYRAWEIEAERIDEADEAEEERREQLGDEEPIEDGMDAIRAGYLALLRDFATPRIIAQEIGPSWQSPPRANLDTTQFVGAEQAPGGAIVKTNEIDHYALPPEAHEYVLKLVDGAWRIDDRRTRDLDGRWIHRVF